MSHRTGSPGFVDFYRRYAKTWIHAVATAALTAFGMLTFVHTAFVLVAIAAYVLPPLVLYARRPSGVESAESGRADAAEESVGNGPSDASESTGNRPTDADSPSEGEPDRGAKESSESESEGDESDGAAGRSPRWTAGEAPTDATLRDVVVAGGRAHAVGDGGVVVASAGSDWQVVLEDGPAAASQTLRGVDATGEGDAVWIAGDGGALGRLDAESGRHVDYSAPDDATDNLTDVAVGGAAGEEVILLANGSGQVRRGRFRDGDVAWDGPTKPGSGSEISAATLEGSAGYLCDTNDGVYETEDGGGTFERVGVDDADGTLTAVAAGGDGCLVTTDEGVVHRRTGGNWTPARVCDGALYAVDRAGDEAVACGDGAVFERDGADWERETVPASGPLYGVAVGSSRTVAVGADGSLLER